jgi:DNA-binding CsgD family transcriptional regulator
MRHAGPIDVLEAAYEIERARDPWLRAVVDAARPLMQPCIEAVGYFINAAGPTIEGIVTTRDSRFRAAEVLDLMQHMPRDLVQRVHFRAARGVATLSEQVAEGSVGRPEFEEFLGRVARMGALAGWEMPRREVRDFLGVPAFDAEGRGVVLSGACDRERRLDRATRRRWTLVGVHLAAAARLRRALEASKREPAAVLSPTGRVEHVDANTASRPIREALRDRVVAIDRSRGRMRRSDPDAALEAWRGLVAGRWSLVDRFESDGRRYVVAHRNEPVPAKMLSLTLRERQVAAHVLAGHTSKVTGYALGISPAAVSVALRSAMHKLRVRNVAELLAACSGMARGVEAPGEKP